MTHIIIEGVDASGKSTLARHVQSTLGWSLQPSEGPPHYPGEMIIRVERYLSYSRVIFDRHPCVSQPIYGTMRSHHDVIPPDLLQRFYAKPTLFIYCDPLERGLTDHVINNHVDTTEHLAQVTSNYTHLLALYREWAIYHAHFVYRIGDPITRLIGAIRGALHVR